VAAHHLHRAGVPYVLVPNGTAPAIERRQLAKHLFDVVAGRRVLRNAARIVAVTETEREQLRCLGVPDSKIRVVPNPIDLDEFKEPCTPGSFRRRHGVDGQPLIVFLGKITPRKRVDLVVRAFAHVRREAAHLVIAGNDMGGGAEARALAASLGVLARCTFTGLLRGRDRLEALADADVVVYPSQDEIFGLVPLEALLAGTPVVVAGDSGCGEVIRGLAQGGQVVPVNDHLALANAIDAVLAAPAAWRAAAADASSQVRARFGEPVVAHSYERLYREMVRR
jgi:glycosyltransferase involved in cell wall biosynthesis